MFRWRASSNSGESLMSGMSLRGQEVANVHRVSDRTSSSPWPFSRAVCQSDACLLAIFRSWPFTVSVLGDTARWRHARIVSWLQSVSRVVALVLKKPLQKSGNLMVQRPIIDACKQVTLRKFCSRIVGSSFQAQGESGADTQSNLRASC